MGGATDMLRKGCESSIHGHDIDLCVTMVGWVVVSDSDRGDFRRWCGVDISSYQWANQDLSIIIFRANKQLNNFITKLLSWIALCDFRGKSFLTA